MERGIGHYSPESHPEPRGFPVQWADPGVNPAIKSSDRPGPRPRARVATGRSDCSHRFTGRLFPCKACYSICACLCILNLLTDARVCSLRTFKALVMSPGLAPPCPWWRRGGGGEINTLLSHVGKGQPLLDAPNDHRTSRTRRPPLTRPSAPPSRSQPNPARRPRQVTK